jgi:hypothetical protein
MGCRIRRYEVGVVYSAAIRCNDREFLFRPNHNPDNPLLDAACPANALDPSNDITPIPSVINIIGASIGRALSRHPIRLNWFEVNVHHEHDGFTPGDDVERASVPHFFRDAHSLIAREINRLLDRENHVYGERYRAEPCLDDASAEQKLVYAMVNAVKDGQVERVNESPFFSTFHHLAFGEPLEYWYIDRTAWWKKGGLRRGNREKDHMKWVSFELSPLPGWETMSVHQRQTRFRHLVREAEEIAAHDREVEDRAVVGVPALRRLDPRDRPRKPKRSGLQPLCHAADPVLRKAYKRDWREFLKAYRAASIAYRAGDFEIDFPDGSFRPPLITMYTASAL